MYALVLAPGWGNGNRNGQTEVVQASQNIKDLWEESFKRRYWLIGGSSFYVGQQIYWDTVRTSNKTGGVLPYWYAGPEGKELKPHVLIHK